MKHVKLLSPLICGMAFIPVYSQISEVRINEFMASNTSTLADEDNEYSDWIEIFNDSDSDVSLKGWTLTDEKSIPDMWTFPDVTLKPYSYLVLFASGKDRREPGSELHTNFRLSSSGEYLALNDASGNAATALRSFPAQYDDKSYGYTGIDQSNELSEGFGFLNYATPGTPNASGIYDIEFSHKHGFYDSYFTLYLSQTAKSEGIDIYYTTDGSLPGRNSRVYKDGIDISGNCVIRAVALGSQSPEPVAKYVKSSTYLFTDDILRQSASQEGYPSQWGKYSQISGTAIADYEMDPELTSDKAYADSIIRGFRELPVISVVTDKDNLFSNVEDPQTGGIYIFTGPPTGGPGKGWDRPVSFEYFDYKDSVSFQVNCGIRIHGGHSRLADKTPKHSFRLVFKDAFGESKLRYPFFGDSAAQKHNAIVLRCFFGNSWLHRSKSERDYAQYAREAWGKRTQQKMGHPSSYTQFAHLFINGLYWGLYNPLERIDDAYCAEYYGGDETDYDVIKVEDTNNEVEAGEGNLDAWLELIDKCAKASDNQVYFSLTGKDANGNKDSSVAPLLDIENFMDYMLMNFYGANSDWDHHNWIAVRNRINPTFGFRLYSWDAEQLNKNVDDNILKENNPKCPSYIFQKLRGNKHFINAFADRVQIHCFDGGALTPEGAADTWKGILREMESSLFAESARWGDYRRDVHPYSSKGELYRKDVQYNKLKKYMLETQFPKRTEVFISHLRAAGLFPVFDAPSFRINGSIHRGDTINEGDILSMAAADGTIYYTLDGSDPVTWSDSGVGIRNASAIKYTSPFSLDESTIVKARTFYSQKWSALNQKNFTVRDITSIGQTKESDVKFYIKSYNSLFTNSISISYTLFMDVVLNTTIYDIAGVAVYSQSGEYKAGEGDMRFDTSALRKGVYICRISAIGKNSSQEYTIRFIKE